jgi:hypothetical protein
MIGSYSVDIGSLDLEVEITTSLVIIRKITAKTIQYLLELILCFDPSKQLQLQQHEEMPWKFQRWF